MLDTRAEDLFLVPFRLFMLWFPFCQTGNEPPFPLPLENCRDNKAVCVEHVKASSWKYSLSPPVDLHPLLCRHTMKRCINAEMETSGPQHDAALEILPWGLSLLFLEENTRSTQLNNSCYLMLQRFESKPPLLPPQVSDVVLLGAPLVSH